MTAAEFGRFRAPIAEALPGCDAVVLSGSLPRGLPAGTYADLIGWPPASGVPAILDTSGEALLARRRGRGPAIVKPNLAELAASRRPPSALGRSDRARALDRRWPRPPAAAARRWAPAAVVVTLGADGLLAVTADGSLAGRAAAGARESDRRRGRRGGRAGRTAWCYGWSWPEPPRHAAALGAATVAAPVAGEFRAADYERALRRLSGRDLEQV